MNKLLGVAKIIFGFILFLSLPIALFTTIKHNKIETVFAMSIFCVLGADYVYYLIQTGIWNIKNASYRLNFFLWFGLIFHLAFTFFVFGWGMFQ